MNDQQFVPDLQELECAAPLSLTYMKGRGHTLVVSLAGVGTNPSEPPPQEFFAIGSQRGEHHVLFVSDASRSWLNGPEIAERIVTAIETAAKLSDAKRIVALGNSMGGTMALLLARLTRIDAVIAIAPQYSVHPERLPEEKRWQPFRKKIVDWPFEAVDEFATTQTETVIVHGGTADECLHLDRFPRHPRVKHFVFPKLDHRLALRLHRRNQLAPIVDRAIAGEPWKMQRAIERAGGISREQFDADR